MRRLAIIPARGGSKRLPRKNILPILGKPMVAWSIEAAVQSERDLLIGVDEDIVKHNFVVMCCDTTQLYTGENAERITKQGVMI